MLFLFSANNMLFLIFFIWWSWFSTCQ